MRIPILLLTNILLVLFSCQSNTEKPETMEEFNDRPEYVLVIHGGAGTLLRENMTEEKEAAFHAALETALNIGEQILRDSGSALDAVEATVRYMEDSPLFNAGKGAVFTHAGKNELDASIMDGSDMSCGAVAGVTRVKNPISLARAVKEKSEHVFMAREGADAFAAELGLELVDSSYFFTEHRWESLQKALKREDGSSFLSEDDDVIDSKFGTVGAVALDRKGHLAAATSTGGMTNKRWGRIGDSPVIGAGTYADDRTCAVSCTGHGEYFIRLQVAARISALMQYGDVGLEQAASSVIHSDLEDLGGTGGVIAVDREGRIAMPFNTAGMYRGYTNGNDRVIAIYGDDVK